MQVTSSQFRLCYIGQWWLTRLSMPGDVFEARAWHRLAGAVEVEAPRVKIVDTIGTGDSFQAALLFMLRMMDCIDADLLARLYAGQIRRALAFATKCAAITCTRQGADPPRFAEVDGAGSELS